VGSAGRHFAYVNWEARKKFDPYRGLTSRRPRAPASTSSTVVPGKYLIQRAEAGGGPAVASSRSVRSVHPGQTRLAVVSATRPPRCIERQTPR
jgi:hypothetical protein